MADLLGFVTKAFLYNIPGLKESRLALTGCGLGGAEVT